MKIRNTIRNWTVLLCLVFFSQNLIAQRATAINLIVDTEAFIKYAKDNPGQNPPKEFFNNNTELTDNISSKKVPSKDWQTLVPVEGRIVWGGYALEPKTKHTVKIKRIIRNKDEGELVLRLNALFMSRRNAESEVRNNAKVNDTEWYYIKFEVLDAEGKKKGKFKLDPKLKVKQ